MATPGGSKVNAPNIIGYTDSGNPVYGIAGGAIPIGTATLNSITSRSFVTNEVTDLFYQSNPLVYRWRASGKTVQGGLWLEGPVNKSRYDSGVRFTGFDVIPPVPQDTIINYAFDWRQIAVPVTIDGTSILKNNSPESIANLVTTQLALAEMECEDIVGQDLWASTVDPKAIESIPMAVDNATVVATYGGIAHSNSFWQPASGALDTTTATMTLAVLQTVFQAAAEGGRNPTIIVTTDANYSRFWNLNTPIQRLPTGNSGARDEQLAAAGFDNLLFNNIPIVVDSHAPANSLWMLNEDYWLFVTHPDRNFSVDDWLQPTNQDVAVSTLKLMYALVCQNPVRQGALTALTA